MNTALVDLYLSRGRLRAEVPMQGFHRVSDLFNNVPGEFVGATMRTVASLASPGGQELVVEQRDLVVRLRDVRMIRPVDEQPASSPFSGERRPRLPLRVVVELDDWQIVGDLHLVDRVRWIDFMTTVRQRFLPVSRASVRFADLADPLECDFLLVNGARISALYEAP